MTLREACKSARPAPEGCTSCAENLRCECETIAAEQHTCRGCGLTFECFRDDARLHNDLCVVADQPESVV